MRKLSFALCLMVLLMAASRLLGQGANATILGTVTDSSGAVVAKAKVDITNISTSVTNTTSTTSSGDFTVPFLQPGTYTVTVESPGFDKAVTENVSLAVGQQQRINIALKPGAITETVQVQSSSVALDTDSAAVSEIVTQEQVAELPLNGRNFMQLLFLDAGAVQTGGEQATFRAGQGAAISVNGSRPESNNYLLDGMMNTDQALNTPSVVLSVDAIQEFKVLSETYSAQYGFAANQISIVSKGGGNSLHGAIFYFGRNDAVDARNYFNPTTLAKPELRQHQFGFVVSGPVMIPKLYDGKNKTFFMANYEGERIRQGTSGTAVAPSANLLKGLFPSVLTDPTTGKPFAGCTSGGTTYASCIPANRFSRLANVMIGDGLIPAANCFTAFCTGLNVNLITTNAAISKSNQQTYRLDRDLGRWGKIFGRGTYAPFTSATPNSASGNFGNIQFDQAATNWAVQHTISFGASANKINQFSFGRMFSKSNSGGIDGPADLPTRLGFTNVFTNLSGGARLYPRIAFNNTNYSQFGGGLNAYEISESPMWQFVDNLTLIRGAHSITVGGDYKRWNLQRNVANNFLGNFQFSNFATGDPFGDFILGTYSSAGGSGPAPIQVPGSIGDPYQYNFQYFATYVQDDWKVNKSLTLNLGLRWDLRTTPTESNDHMGWFDVTNPNGGVCIASKQVFSQGFADTTGFYRDCGRRNPKDAEKKNFAPRVGFAWRPFGEKTVLRGGYGLFWDGVEGREMDGSAGFYPFGGAFQVANQNAGQASYATSDSLFPAVPGGHFAVPPGGFGTAVTLPAAPWLHNPYVQQYTLSVQRELAKNTMLEVDYVGNKGTHLLTRNNFTQALAFPNAAAAAACVVPQGGTVPKSCTVAARRPYSNLSLWIDDRFIGFSNYNALAVKLEHRAGSMAFTGSYTWSKAMDNKSAAAGVGSSQGAGGWNGFLNQHNPAADYGRSDYDTGQHFVGSAVYDLPFGKGKRFLGNANPLANAVVGGWELTSIYTAQLGFPMDIAAPDQTSLLDLFFSPNRADLVGKVKMIKSRTQWFDTSAFAQPAPNLFGNSARNSVRMPGINNFDIGVLKSISFTERASLQLRLETFNTLNHPQFNPDPSIPNFSGGGSTVDNTINLLGPTGVTPNPTFGKITSAGAARIVQLGGKIVF